MEGEGQVQSIRLMIEAGISVQSEPYLRGMLSAIRLHLLKVASPCKRLTVSLLRAARASLSLGAPLPASPASRP